jgi:hypothetical protein
MDDERFLAIATEVVNGLEGELRRAGPEERGKWRALEIECGSGRLMRAVSRHFEELHGAESSPELVGRAQNHLRDVSNARVVQADPNQLEPFDPHTYDFVYSLDPSIATLRQIRRVLKPGGYCWMRFDTMRARLDLLEFAQAEDFQVLAFENTGAQGLWTAWRKQPRGWFASLPEQNGRPDQPSEEFPVVIRRITNASNSEPLAPCRGRFASIAIYAENLPADAGLHHLRVTVGSSFGNVTYIGPRGHAGYGAGYQQVRADLPELEATGLLPVQLHWVEAPISAPVAFRVIPPGPSVPRVVALSKLVAAHALKLTAEDIGHPEEMQVLVGGLPVEELDYVCTDRRARRFEIAIELPKKITPGKHPLELRVGRRKLPSVEIEVVA